ncbi:protein of unknown function [Taphrina deformans PYCC 5710]|uniref:glucan endo-1,3-beta-D-glucosidase n=1 Tax=Taphrina deformans (strain PYCC 5710 / ATCC 11124 / CBS 356.35 / IMI 108563 / JCM 9778 / NBRC 8474) TaxID=1097556 RepID=R4XE40_TAPDE|nr:protein of unknown function [Taphrina deformans PYCC 5710]|eukprot:CCG83932.1 protein of unknown function [Taphrina deformans PYCC 5710]
MAAPPDINYATKPKPVASTEDIYRRSDTSSQNDIFTRRISTNGPHLPYRSHDLQPKSVEPCSTSGLPIQTNKFYANFLLGSQKSQVYALPYLLKWSGYGLDINHTDEEQRVFGPDDAQINAQYYFCPVGIVSLSLTAREQPRFLRLSETDQFSVNVTLQMGSDSQEMLSLPIVRGSAFVTAHYQKLTPCITSDVMIRHVENIIVTENITKWRLILEDGKVWLIYAVGKESLRLEHHSNREMCARSTWSGLLQVAKLPRGDPAVERLFDYAAGTYPTTIELHGRVMDQARYSFKFNKVGAHPVLAYALPHHIESFDDCMAQKTYRNALASQTNGSMTLVWADEWNMHAQLPNSNELTSCPVIPDAYKPVIVATIEEDSRQDFDSQIRADSMYFCGKALNKLAQLTLLTAKVQSPSLHTLLTKLESNILFFARNQQQYGLLYDQTWGGIVSSQGFINGDGSDFGNTWYNDHHYHYGYHIESAAIFLELFPNSVARMEIERWVRDLIRDVASPVNDSWFCAYRAMDWFVGHSWSKGLYESADGKDEESSSEDYNMSYAMYLFARVVGDTAMADRARLQLAVQRSSITAYMLFSEDNTTVPSQISQNRVSGIKFENKIDYTTYFGANKEYIHGIHILPISPITPFFRKQPNKVSLVTLLSLIGQPNFVRSEWLTKLGPLIEATPQMQPGWRGILYANLGLIEGPGGEAWRYFMDRVEVDGGQMSMLDIGTACVALLFEASMRCG